jgi:hypothetical protein
MATPVDHIGTLDLGDFNFGLTGALGVINPLAAQLDAAVSLGLGPLQADLAAALDASLGVQAQLSLTVSNPLADIAAAIAALVELQASLQASLALPTISINADLSAQASISAALSARLGGLQLLLDAIIAVKIPAVKLLGDLQAALGADVEVLSYDGLPSAGPPPDGTLADMGNKIQALFSSGVGGIGPNDQVSGIIVLASVVASFDAMGAIMVTSP